MLMFKTTVEKEKAELNAALQVSASKKAELKREVKALKEVVSNLRDDMKERAFDTSCILKELKFQQECDEKRVNLDAETAMSESKVENDNAIRQIESETAVKVAEVVASTDRTVADVMSASELRIKVLEDALSVMKQECELAAQAEINVLRDEVQASLVESDMRRVAAETALETYLSIDNKTDKEQNAKLLETLVEGTVSALKKSGVVQNITTTNKTEK